MSLRTPQRHKDGPVAAADPRTVERLRLLSHWLDSRFRVPGTNWRLGLDGLIGLVPGVGDATTMILSAYIIAEAARLGAPRSALVRMAINLGIDTIVGAVPLVGDLFDIGWKTNRRNMNILLRHLESMPHPNGRQGAANPSKAHPR